MFYFDSSALIKRYLRERGTAAVNARFLSGERLFTSALTYAEVHAVLGRKRQMKELTSESYERARDEFTTDWLYVLTILEVDTNVMANLLGLVNRYRLRGADAVHLSSVHWLRDMCMLPPDFANRDSKLELVASDKQLVRYARDYGFDVFDPGLAEASQE